MLTKIKEIANGMYMHWIWGSRPAPAAALMPFTTGVVFFVALANVWVGNWLGALIACPLAGLYAYLEINREKVRDKAFKSLDEATIILKAQQQKIDRYERIFNEQQRCFKESKEHQDA